MLSEAQPPEGAMSDAPLHEIAASMARWFGQVDIEKRWDRQGEE